MTPFQFSSFWGSHADSAFAHIKQILSNLVSNKGILSQINIYFFQYMTLDFNSCEF